MITRMSNGWYMFDEHEVPRIIDALLVAGYQRLPHWFFVHGHNHITLQYSGRGMSILAPPDVWDAYTALFNCGDGEGIAGRLDRPLGLAAPTELRLYRVRCRRVPHAQCDHGQRAVARHSWPQTTSRARRA
jgi:hypothetical protein